MGNFAISPVIWERLFSRVDSPSLGLTFDPSHLVWEFIDPYAAMQEWIARIYHVHAKDTEIHHDVLRRTGILTDFSWWRYRIPGWGELDWRRMLTTLLEHGYDGYVSVEHEDPVFTGSLARVEQGLSLALHHLRNALPAV
jgi:sugar phosphate isomerase/epimerase